MKTRRPNLFTFCARLAIIIAFLFPASKGFAQSYCSPVNGYGWNCCDIGISEVEVSGLPSGNFVNSTGTPQFDGDQYEYDYTGSYSFSVVPCQTFNLTISNPGSYSQHTRAWIDWDNDGNFNNYGDELVFETPTSM